MISGLKSNNINPVNTKPNIKKLNRLTHAEPLGRNGGFNHVIPPAKKISVVMVARKQIMPDVIAADSGTPARA
jgi:hypothetical protein